jgi:hypothetical protein
MSLVNTNRSIRLAAAILAACSAARSAHAQSPDRPGSAATASKPTPRTSAFCVQGRPIAQCLSFAVMELPIGARVIHTQRSASHGAGDAYVGLELGAMVNRSETSAIGATISAAASAADSHFSISARSRTWLSDRSYRDVSLGVLATGTTGRRAAYGLTGTVGTGYSDLIGVFAGADFGFLGGAPRASLHAGARIGSYATLSLFGLAAALLAVGGGIHEDT